MELRNEFCNDLHQCHWASNSAQGRRFADLKLVLGFGVVIVDLPKCIFYILCEDLPGLNKTFWHISELIETEVGINIYHG